MASSNHPSDSLATPPSNVLEFQQPQHRTRSSDEGYITLAHGSGGRATHNLITDIFLETFHSDALNALDDSARLDLALFMARGDRLAFTTDSFVVDPLFFPGGDIGSLAINGTVNDLAVTGAQPLYLSCGFIIEEGTPIALLRRIAQSMKLAADTARVKVVAGDTKVVPRGKGDQIYINTAGVGVARSNQVPGPRYLQPGDAILLSGPMGDHGTAILLARGDLALEADITSDCQPLHDLAAALCEACPTVRAMRDATRGGVAAVLNEFAQTSRVSMVLEEAALPVRPPVAAACEVLGLDPLHMANEGLLVAVVPGEFAARALMAMQMLPEGREACLVGHVTKADPPVVILQTSFGSERIIEWPMGDPLPRIC